MPDYSSNDPKGWGGNPSRGAALGRSTVQHGDRASAKGKFYLRRVRLNDGGYDPNGTYFGHGAPLYWCAYENEETGHDVDFMLRACDRASAKDRVREDYPNAQFFN